MRGVKPWFGGTFVVGGVGGTVRLGDDERVDDVGSDGTERSKLDTSTSVWVST